VEAPDDVMIGPVGEAKLAQEFAKDPRAEAVKSVDKMRVLEGADLSCYILLVEC
jgi:hypothetical protein